MFDQMKLSNGLTIVGERLPHFRSVSVGLWIGVGSQYEAPGEGGLSHFLEHMAFKGTDRRTARQIAEAMDEVGGQLNAFTAKEMTCFYAKVIDEHAAAHDGLAPIALVVDQLGDPTADPMCLDTDLGKVESYVMQDVVPWAREHLDVLRSAASWTVAGYSNGGGCAAYFGAKYPEVFGNILAVSPVEYAGAEHPQDTLRDVFGGDQAAYDAVKPANIMAAKAPYPDSTAVFTAGENDPAYVASATALTDAATAAGIAASRFLVPGADHGVSALLGGLDHGFDVLYPRLGLVAP